jgi:inositol phosphorylceramide mannosyltransferase catalytic subunit
MIPFNVLQFWHDRNTLPMEFYSASKTTKESCPEFNFIDADDEMIRHLMRKSYGTSLQKVYELNRVPASRSDLARYVLLWEYGGFYLDMGMELHSSLAKFINPDVDLVFVKRDDREKFSDNPAAAPVMNGILGAPPKSAFIGRCLEQSVYNLSTGRYNNLVSQCTGPFMLNGILQEFSGKMKFDILSFAELLQGFLCWIRLEGVSNGWGIQQLDGIIAPELFENGVLRLTVP